jgi:hypothetical protein
MTPRLLIATLNALALVLPTICSATSYTFTTLDNPLGANTEVHGISGNNVVGSYWEPGTNLSHGFVYNGATFTTLDDPLGANTEIFGISGNDIFGAYREAGTNLSHGFLAQTPVPEPSSVVLAALGFIGLALWKCRANNVSGKAPG